MPIIQVCDKRVLCKSPEQREVFRKKLEKFNSNAPEVRKYLKKSNEEAEKFIHSERVCRRNLEAKLATVVIGNNVHTR